MPELFVGTNGLSLWSSNDLGETLSRLPTDVGLYSGSQVWSLSVHRSDLKRLYIGTNTGIYVLDRETQKCRHLASLASFTDRTLVTALRHAPDDPDTIYAGTQPAAVYKSTDGGLNWRQLDAPMEPYLNAGSPAGDMHAADPSGVVVRHWTRVTHILIDPQDTRRIFAGVEINGLWRSLDGGEHWQKASSGLVSEDIHSLCLTRTRPEDSATVFAATNRGLHISTDQGSTWKFNAIDSPKQYTRSVTSRADASGVMFLTNGDTSPGSTGRLFRSRDRGRSWHQVQLPAQTESSLYWLAVHESDASLIFAGTSLGQLFRSMDGGETWTAIKRRLPEIRTLMWLPD